MTPFGQKLRELRSARGISLKSMAHGVGVSPAYLSALEHGRRGAPTWYLVQRVIAFFNIIWDEAEELERLAAVSRPKVSIDTGGLSPSVTRAANLFAQYAARLTDEEAEQIVRLLQAGERAP